MSSLLEKFVATAPPEMWRDVHVGVALSGGPDSVALVRATAELKRQVGGKGEVVALHVNHKLRGAESDGDAAWCGALCQRLAIPLVVLTGDVQGRATADGDGIEAAARAERYRLLTGAAELHGSRYLLMGHTRDDQVETVLFRILRGTGVRGLAGMAASRVLTASLTLLRPLLACTRGEVIAFLDDCGQDYRVDSSNASCEFARNRIRTELLPLLRENYSADVDEALVRLAEQAGTLQAHLEAQAKEGLEAAREWISPVGFALNTAMLRKYTSCSQDTAGQASSGTPGISNPLSNALVSEALRLAWREAQLPEQAMTREWWVKLADLTRQEARDVVLSLPGRVRVELARGILVVEHEAHPRRK